MVMSDIMAGVVRQYIKSMNIDSAKGLKKLRLTFKEEGLTAILGPNGCGKSTILHLLACAYSRQDEGSAYRYPDFFLPVSYSGETDALNWNGTSFSYEYCINEQSSIREIIKTSQRWCYYDKRPSRWVFYVGIDTCIPDIEREKRKSRINFHREELVDTRILHDASRILGKEYTDYRLWHRYDGRTNIKVSVREQAYTSLSMGAGEQRVFRILEEVENAKPYGLILIDEIDLLLHQFALERLIETLVEKSRNKHLQIIFTAHNQSILGLSNIEFRHIYHRNHQTECLIGNNADALYQLTGQSSQKDLNIFVEDELAKALVQKICLEENCLTRVGVVLYGAIENCFSLIVGLHLGREDLEKKLFITDGDRYTSLEDRINQLERKLSGTEEFRKSERVELAKQIKQFILENNDFPEGYYHQLIASLPEISSMLTQRHEELRREIQNVSRTSLQDSHDWLLQPFQRLGMDKSLGYALCADLIAAKQEWYLISSEVRNEIRSKLKIDPTT